MLESRVEVSMVSCPMVSWLPERQIAFCAASYCKDYDPVALRLACLCDRWPFVFGFGLVRRTKFSLEILLEGPD
jgi:hypothetical protein